MKLATLKIGSFEQLELLKSELGSLIIITEVALFVVSWTNAHHPFSMFSKRILFLLMFASLTTRTLIAYRVILIRLISFSPLV